MRVRLIEKSEKGNRRSKERNVKRKMNNKIKKKRDKKREKKINESAIVLLEDDNIRTNLVLGVILYFYV
jgi:hypothetical protein